MADEVKQKMQDTLYYWNDARNNGEQWEDMWLTYGIAMGSGFLNALNAPAPMKDYIEGQSRLEHGKVVLVTNARQASRDVTLAFNVHGETEEEMATHRDAFYELLYKGKVRIKVAYKSGREDVFNLIYKKSSSYSQGYSRRVCVVSVKFEEPNPTNRTE